MTFDNLQKRNRWIKGGTLKALSLSALFLFSFLFLINLTSAWNFQSASSGGGIVVNNFTINGSTAIHNDLDGLQGGVSGEYYHIRATWYNKLNSDINDWITDGVSTLTNYYTKTEANAINASVNNYIATIVAGSDTFVGNYSTFLLNNESLTNYINSNNDSLVNYILYVNSTNSEGQVDTFIANYSQFLLNNESLTNYIAENNQSVINYIALVNTSMKNYVDSLSSYDNTWINSTIDNKILEQNNSLVNYILIQNNSLINYYLEQNGSLINYIAVVNESMKNYVDYQISLIGNYDDSWINSTIDNKISTNNASVVNWANSIFATISALSNYVEISNIVNLVGNWSADKGNYYTKTETNEINTSMKNYVDSLSGYDDTWINNTIDNKISENNNSVIDYITENNNSIVNWITSTFTSLADTLDALGNWSADKSNYYTKTDINNFNESYLNTYNQTTNDTLVNYILYVNSTNSVGTSYDDTWINGTIDSKILTNNQSVINWISNTFNETRNNYVNLQNSSLVNYILVVNNSMKNYVDYQISQIAQYDDTWINGTIDNKIIDNNNTIMSILNNGSYFNQNFIDTFIGNYSTFLTHITYADIMNGTLKDYFDTIYQPIGSYLTEETNWNANYSQFLLNNESVTNALNTKLNINQWNATNESYMTGENFTLQNTSMKNYVDYQISLIGVYDDSWINSTIDSKIAVQNTSINNWANSVFATISSLSNYVQIANIINLVGNWSADKTNYYTKTEVNAINTSMKNYVDWVNSTNGVGGEGSYDDSWINDTIDTKINAGLISYNETKSIEILEWMSQMNISINNYINNIFNTTRNNYVAFVNTSMKNYADTKLSLSGGTMTGNISLSNSGVRLTNGTQNTAVIYHNGTGWIIRG